MDPATFDFYQTRAREWADALPFAVRPWLDDFLDRLPAGATILELGCGDGRDAERMLARGFDVHASDGSPEMARLAGERLGREVRVMEFTELEAVERFDAVWCNACLLHVAEAELPSVLTRIHRALKPGGLHRASYKGGAGGGRDEYGRFFSYLPGERLEAAYRAAGAWREFTIAAAQGRSFGGSTTTWYDVLARK